MRCVRRLEQAKCRSGTGWSFPGLFSGLSPVPPFVRAHGLKRAVSATFVRHRNKTTRIANTTTFGSGGRRPIQLNHGDDSTKSPTLFGFTPNEARLQHPLTFPYFTRFYFFCIFICAISVPLAYFDRQAMPLDATVSGTVIRPMTTPK